MYTMTKLNFYLEKLDYVLWMAEWGKQTFLVTQIANPHILGLIPLSQIRKFLRCASPQIANLIFALLICKWQYLNFYKIMHNSV
jgi:hypothetical protein